MEIKMDIDVYPFVSNTSFKRWDYHSLRDWANNNLTKNTFTFRQHRGRIILMSNIKSEAFLCRIVWG